MYKSSNQALESGAEPFVERDAILSKLNTMTHLHTIATRFVQEGDIFTVLLEIIDAATSITNADKGTIQLISDDEQCLKLVAARGFSSVFLDHFAVCPVGRGAGGTAWQLKERVIVEDVMKCHTYADFDSQLVLAEGVRAVQATPLRNRAGKILGVLSTHYQNPIVPKTWDLQMLDLLARLSADIIENGQWAQERAKWIEILREADRRKDKFLAILSHELRNPLAAISNSSFMLSHAAPGSDQAKRAQATIDRQLKHITRLIDDLLDITRITQNKIQLRRQPIDVNELVRRTTEDNASFFSSLDIKLKVELSNAPVMINGDPTRIEQVISNLLQNASKFSTAGGITQVSVGMEDKMAVIRVKDDGIGIEADLLDHMFEPFMQADKSQHDKGGIGLGLALVKGFVVLHDGSVSVESAGINQGAEFTVKLPLIEGVEVINRDGGLQKSKPMPKRCVLIIEDNRCVADSLEMVFEVLGHMVFISSNGLEGIQKAKTIKPDFIFCDIGLPGMNGYEVAKMLKADESLAATYLVALSGYAQLEDIKKSREAGFDLHMSKPPNLAILKQLLIDGRPE